MAPAAISMLFEICGTDELIRKNVLENMVLCVVQVTFLWPVKWYAIPSLIYLYVSIDNTYVILLENKTKALRMKLFQN